MRSDRISYDFNNNWNSSNSRLLNFNGAQTPKNKIKNMSGNF